jgi:hypothetical protein
MNPSKAIMDHRFEKEISLIVYKTHCFVIGMTKTSKHVSKSLYLDYWICYPSKDERKNWTVQCGWHPNLS